MKKRRIAFILAMALLLVAVAATSIFALAEEEVSDKVYTIYPYIYGYESPSVASMPVKEFIPGTPLRLIEDDGTWSLVEYKTYAFHQDTQTVETIPVQVYVMSKVLGQKGEGMLRINSPIG